MNFDPNMLMQFMQFQNSFRGNPQQMIQQMLNSGRITQAQYNAAASRAQQIMRMLPTSVRR